MVKHGGAQHDPVAAVDRVAGVEVLVLDLGLEALNLDWKQRRAHHGAQGLLEVKLRQQVAGPDSQLMAISKQRGKERQSGDVVEMDMGEEQVGVDRGVGLEQFITERTQAASAVQDDDAVVAA